MKSYGKKAIYILGMGLALFLNVCTARAAYEYEVFDEYLPVEYTDKIAWGGDYILLEKTETGFSASDHYYGLYDYINGNWVMEYQLFNEGYFEDAEYAGDGIFLIPRTSNTHMSPLLLNGKTGKIVSLDGLQVSNLNFVGGIALARANEENEKTDIYVVSEEGVYYSTEIMKCYENTSSIIHGGFYRDENYAVYIFSDSTFIIYDINEDISFSFDRTEYAQKLTSLNSEAELVICGDYMVFLNMEGNDGKNYYAVTTLDGTDYIMATVCDYSTVTEDGNLLVISDGEINEIVLANQHLPDHQPISNLALIACEKEDREVMLVNIDRKCNLYQNSIVYKDIFYLDTNPPYDMADVYYLGGKYSTFSGIWYLPDDSLENGSVYVRLMGDGKVLYESDVLNAQTCSEKFSVDVSGIKKLGIEYSGNYNLGDIAVGLADGEFISAAAEDSIMDNHSLIDEESDNREESGFLESVKLYDLHAYMGELNKAVIVTDNMGNTYDKAIRTFGSEKSATYDIGGKYSLLYGTVAVTKADQNNDYARDKRGCIRIYGDGNLLWEDADLNSATKPYDMSVDITGVIDLKVELIGFQVNLMLDSMDVIFNDATLSADNLENAGKDDSLDKTELSNYLGQTASTIEQEFGEPNDTFGSMGLWYLVYDDFVFYSGYSENGDNIITEIVIRNGLTDYSLCGITTQMTEMEAEKSLVEKGFQKLATNIYYDERDQLIRIEQDSGYQDTETGRELKELDTLRIDAYQCRLDMNPDKTETFQYMKCAISEVMQEIDGLNVYTVDQTVIAENNDIRFEGVQNGPDPLQAIINEIVIKGEDSAFCLYGITCKDSEIARDYLSFCEGGSGELIDPAGNILYLWDSCDDEPAVSLKAL